MDKPKIIDINGPVVKACGMSMYKVRDMVVVGEKKLIGEIISVQEDIATIQVYEETQGLKVGEEILSTNVPLSVTLGPGIIGNIFDGIQRPLERIYDMTGDFISEGIGLISIDKKALWQTEIIVKVGDYLNEGECFAKIQETSFIEHKVLVPPTISGQVVEVLPSGKYDLETNIVTLKDEDGKMHNLKLYHTWPVRTPRPVKKRMQISKPLITGQRVLDVFFPIAKGGTSALPGGFGTGKTMTQHQLAKWSDADIIVYIGCGERGNEMTEVLEQFPKLIDPRTGKPLMERTVLIANTSNMPVAAREASIYTGITIAEYYRDMGYHVAIMADSTSRWAEALREISGRLEEMPAEEGYPAYLPSRIAGFYERAGDMETLNHETGSVSIIGAVSPQGGDFSEPVTQNTKRFVRCFWGLDSNLAHARHYPAINWMNSYSQYVLDLSPWFNEHISHEFVNDRAEMMKILHEEDELNEVVKLIGSDTLPDRQKLILQTAKVIRLGFLQQNTFHKIDSAVPINKQADMLKVILYLHHRCEQLIQWGMPMTYLAKSAIFNHVINMKYDVLNTNYEPQIKKYLEAIDAFYDKAMQENG